MEPPLEPYSLSFLPPSEAPEILILFHYHCTSPPPLRAAIQLIESASGVSPQESQLSLGGQHCVGELDEELASAFPVFIRNAVLGQKQLKKARTEPCRSTDAVSMASHSGKCQPSLGQGGLGGQSPRPSARPTHLFFLL